MKGYGGSKYKAGKGAGEKPKASTTPGGGYKPSDMMTHGSGVKPKLKRC